MQKLAAMQKKIKISYWVILVALLICLVLSFFLAISIGTVKIDLGVTYRVVIGKIFRQEQWLEGLSKVSTNIVWKLRLPRVILALAAGAGLALCGAVMQATVQNPIAEPYILGVSSGSTFGATLIVSLGLATFIPLGAFAGAILATIMVLGIASYGGKMSSTKLILSGTVVSTMFVAFANFIISVFGSSDAVMSIKFWTMGSLANASWENIGFPFIIVSIIIVFFLFQYRIMNTMLLGEEAAVTLGINLNFYRKLYMILCALLTGILVASCGIIGFVGLVIPHVSRAFVGSNHKKLIPIVVILGSIFLMWADVLARILLRNSELPIGIFTAIIGAPFFLYILVKKNYARGS